jgi:polysaccharide deacetylase 2 family uncharacterized protein YibQ
MNKQLLVIVVLLCIVAALFGVINSLRLPPEKARIAIVLDDWGNNSSHLVELYKIREPITLAVMPQLPYSAVVAREARKNRYEVILHVPIESYGNKSPEPATLYCSMTPEQIQEKLSALLDDVPGISGVNNHQGSRGTEDLVMMDVVMKELHSRHLFFLDSLTTSRSVCSGVAASVGVKFAKRDVFLDLPPGRLTDEQVREHVRKQLEILYLRAVNKGSAVGIGHDRKTTLEVLQEVMPRMRKQGIRFVFLSELER